MSNKVLDTIWQCFHIGEPYSYTDLEYVWKFGRRTVILYIFPHPALEVDDGCSGRCSLAMMDGNNVAFMFDDVSVEQFEIAQAFLFKEDMRDIENNKFKLYDLIIDTMIDVNFEPSNMTEDPSDIQTKRHELLVNELLNNNGIYVDPYSKIK